MVLAKRLHEVENKTTHCETDEGYNYSNVEYSFEIDDDIEYIVADVSEGGRDCDGRMDYFSTLRAIITLKKDFKWHRIKSSQRDHEAEKAGY